ncbi:MAG: hypothetical protein Q4D74_01670 [Comamonadaceae bacterium]|nr:hypothetical protein [Comamonadaceae bacterium]
MQPHAPRRPLYCRGAAFPCGDGLDIGWWALPADISLLQPSGLSFFCSVLH